ncbi:unnamed protein product [Clavelina lepadiformis]|uniref:Uncharacterized protein n=1 Tax=Clavelina lepadiformis TaxID=159417 RepID=A0ABP0FUV0_CLALP
MSLRGQNELKIPIQIILQKMSSYENSTSKDAVATSAGNDLGVSAVRSSCNIKALSVNFCDLRRVIITRASPSYEHVCVLAFSSQELHHSKQCHWNMNFVKLVNRLHGDGLSSAAGGSLMVSQQFRVYDPSGPRTQIWFCVHTFLCLGLRCALDFVPGTGRQSVSVLWFALMFSVVGLVFRVVSPYARPAHFP